MQFLHGSMGARVEAAFKSVRVMLFFGAEGEDVEVLNASENIAKEEYKRHCELENIMVVQQWCENMRTAKPLDPTKAIDVFKFSAVLGDPRKPAPRWLAGLLGQKPPTRANKIAAVTKKEVTSR
eukprot:2068202-Pyramimonas_sp.AAC.1